MAMMKEASQEDNKFKRWFTPEELEKLNALAYQKESVNAGNVYPDLFSQMSYSMKHIAKLKDSIFDMVENMIEDSGDSVSKHLIKSIYSDFVTDFMDGDGDLGNCEEEVTISRKYMFEFANSISCKISAAEMISSIAEQFQNIRKIEKDIDLAKKGVLI